MLSEVAQLAKGTLEGMRLEICGSPKVPEGSNPLCGEIAHVMLYYRGLQWD